MYLYEFINCCTSHDALLCLLQAVDAASLLRLYLNFDLLDAAAELVLEYVDALLGKGHQYFGIEVRWREEHKHRRPTASRRSDEPVSLKVQTTSELSFTTASAAEFCIFIDIQLTVPGSIPPVSSDRRHVGSYRSHIPIWPMNPCTSVMLIRSCYRSDLCLIRGSGTRSLEPCGVNPSLLTPEQLYIWHTVNMTSDLLLEVRSGESDLRSVICFSQWCWPWKAEVLSGRHSEAAVLAFVCQLSAAGGVKNWTPGAVLGSACVHPSQINMCVLQRPLSATASSVWLPYTSIDQLLKTLNETQTHSGVSHRHFLFSPHTEPMSLRPALIPPSLFGLQMYNKVRDKLDNYHQLVAQTTKLRLVARWRVGRVPTRRQTVFERNVVNKLKKKKVWACAYLVFIMTYLYSCFSPQL